MVLNEASVFKKLESLPTCIEACLGGQPLESVPEIPKRDIAYLPIHFLTGRLGLSTLEGQQKLLHDLANIELQAMELGLRTLMEFPQAPKEFREQLAGIVLEEARHLKMCLQSIEHLGGEWGRWPVHLGLWHATHKKDSLLERVFIVHRYLEGSGLDAGDTLLRRLSGIQNKVVKQTVYKIVSEEVDHVHFGSRWYRNFAEAVNLDEQAFFKRMLDLLARRHPRRDKISETFRKTAGFTKEEIEMLKRHRENSL